MSKTDYLEEERKKLWAKIISLEEEFNKRTPEFESEAKQASRKASEYRNRCEDSMNSAIKYLESAKNYEKEICELADILNIKYNELQFLISNSLDTNREVNKLSENTEQKLKSIESNVNSLNELFDEYEIFENKISTLEEFYAKTEDLAIKVETSFKSVSSRRKEIDELYYEIVGYTEKDEDGEDINYDGLKDELSKAYDEIRSDLDTLQKVFKEAKIEAIKNYQDFIENKKKEFSENNQFWQDQHKVIKERIERLLPNALTAGLSYAYSEKKEEEVKESKSQIRRFNVAIGGLIIVSLIPFGVSINSLFENVDMNEVILRLPRLVLSILPLYIPVLWVAYSSNKKLNLSKRLIEEYAHKEVLSKTFEGLSKQIENIENSEVSNDLRTKLLYNILEVSSENPGKLISDYNKSDHPLMDALDKSVKLANAVEKLSNIPGFTKLASSLEKKSKDSLKEQDNKAEKGIDSVVNPN